MRSGRQLRSAPVESHAFVSTHFGRLSRRDWASEPPRVTLQGLQSAFLSGVSMLAGLSFRPHASSSSLATS